MIVTTRRRPVAPPPKPEPLSASVRVYLTEAERADLARRAAAAGSSLSAFCRPKLTQLTKEN